MLAGILMFIEFKELTYKITKIHNIEVSQINLKLIANNEI